MPPQDIQTSPLIFFLLHSGLFVLILAVLFCTFGLLFGRATWGPYKKQVQELEGEASELKAELVKLKRMLTEKVLAAPGVRPVAPSNAALSSTAPVATPLASLASVPVPPEPDAAPPQRSTLPVAIHLSELIAHKKPAANPPPTPPSTTTATARSSPPSAPASRQASRPAASPSTPAIEPLPWIGSDKDHAHGGGAHSVIVDDLTQIRGIGSVIQQRLYENGIHTLRQIALWTPEDVRAFSSRLAFKDRIEREKWVDQARALHIHLHGSVPESEPA